MHFDQLNVIAKHLEDIKREANEAQMAKLPTPTLATICTTMPEASVESANPPLPPPEPPPSEEVAQSFTKK
jgi:hypothetical protein